MLMGVVSKLVPDAIYKDTIDSLNVCRYQRTLKETNVRKTVKKEVNRRKRVRLHQEYLIVQQSRGLEL